MEAKVQEILKIFEEINTIPRKSKNEQAISNWLVAWAKDNNFSVHQDETLNVYITIPATSGRENDPIVILQGHMDMVCEKTPDSPHDFSKDSIKHLVDGEWLHADNTTLGADNGIAIAIAMVLATDDSLSRPPLELLFTVDEETGLNGAVNIQQEHLKGKILLNLDSEDEGVFTIGCAGGRDVEIALELEKDSTATEARCFKIAVDGLKGGHSGVDIHEHRANANVFLGRMLDYLCKEAPSLQMGSIHGGSAHNAIPRNSYCTVSVIDDEREALINTFEQAALKLEEAAKTYDPDIAITLTELDESSSLYTKESSQRVVALLNTLPHGILQMSVDIENLVETSTNFATMEMKGDSLHLLCSQRSSVAQQLDWAVAKVESAAKLCGAPYTTGQGYPGWEPNVNSSILATCKKVYTELFQKEPHVEAIHAGLECGLIGAKFKDMDMISFGPTIKNPHSPEEKLHLPSVEKIWDFTKALLQAIN